MTTKLRILRFNGEVYINAKDLDHWLAERALDYVKPSTGMFGPLVAQAINSVKIRISNMLKSLPKREDDVIVKPGKVIIK